MADAFPCFRCHQEVSASETFPVWDSQARAFVILCEDCLDKEGVL